MGKKYNTRNPKQLPNFMKWSGIQVTDLKWYDEDHQKWRAGYYMSYLLAMNLLGIPAYLDKAWDVVGIISGHSKVRIGKMLPIGSDILMSDGSWKKIENINIGDKVISPSVDGKKSSIEIVEEKIGHKQLEMCEIKSSKDNSLLYRCCVEHNVPVRTLWIKTHPKRPTEYIWKDEVYQAGDLASKNETWFKNHCPKIITSPTITKFETKDFGVDPYLLGLYLGDGWICSKNRIKISNPDKNIYNWLKKNTKVIDKTKDNINIKYDTSKLQCGTGAYNKKIPREALVSSYEYRKRLFEGLLDTDAYINPKGFVTYTTASEQLALDVEELCNTLGCRASINIIYKNCQTFKEKRKYYNVYINTGELSRELNLLRDRKKRLLEVDLGNNQNKDSQFETITINKINERMDGYCIQVSGDSKLYVTDNYSVTHNSTLAQQVGYFIAWLLAGGKMGLVDLEGSPYPQMKVTHSPDKEVHFNLDNIVFSPEELMKKADDLYKKYGRNQVIIYDEGRAGLDSARAMEAINKVMQDFFQTCGQYGHIILIVLPNFFKLHEDYAVNRSLFLIDVYANQKLQRGFFNFYNERQKEFLFNMAKKKLIVSHKYSTVEASFFGRFTKFLPLNKEEYEEMKRKAINKKKITRMEIRWKKRLNAAIYLLKRETDWEFDKLAEELGIVSGEKISSNLIKWSINTITHKKQEVE